MDIITNDDAEVALGLTKSLRNPQMGANRLMDVNAKEDMRERRIRWLVHEVMLKPEVRYENVVCTTTSITTITMTMATKTTTTSNIIYNTCHPFTPLLSTFSVVERLLPFTELKICAVTYEHGENS